MRDADRLAQQSIQLNVKMAMEIGKTICDRCAMDNDDPWGDPHPGFLNVHYRVTAHNVAIAVLNVR